MWELAEAPGATGPLPPTPPRSWWMPTVLFALYALSWLNRK